MLSLRHRSFCWAIKWSSVNRLDGKRQYFICDVSVPHRVMLFETRKEARDYINEAYGYIRQRQDLKQEPHGWKVPTAVKVTVDVVGLRQ